MKKYFITFLLASVFLTLNAGGEKKNAAGETAPAAPMITLTGTVVDLATNEPLTGVEINIEGTDIKTYTDFDGNFVIENIKSGEYNLIASFISYRNSLVENFNATGTDKVNIKLQTE